MTNIAIDRSQQQQLHNARVYFDAFKQKYRDHFSPKMLDDFNQAFKLFTNAHEPIREEETRIFDEKWAHYDAMKDYYGLSSVWSMYEIDRLDESVPPDMENIHTIVYEGHSVTVTKRPEHPWLRWTDVYEACDRVICLSGDNHHIFIEALRKDLNGVYHLTTGS